MTKEEKDKWLKKFKEVDIPEKKYKFFVGAEIDEAFTKLYNLLEDCENETGIFLLSEVRDDIPDIFFGSVDNDEVTDLLYEELGHAATWRDISYMLAPADRNREVFCLTEDSPSSLCPVDDRTFYVVRDAIIKALEEIDD
jgi:hypothetical protein